MSSPGRQRATEFAVDCKFSAPAHARGFRGAENLAERAVYRAWAGWAGSIRGHVMGPSTGLNIDAIQATIDGKSLPIQHYDDFSLVF